MSSIFDSARYSRNGSELCQVFFPSYVKYFVCELCQVFAKSRIQGIPRRMRCDMILRIIMYVCTYERMCDAQKPSTQPLSYHRESRYFSLYCICYRTCILTHWLFIRLCGLFIHRSYLAFLYAGSYGHFTRSLVHSTHTNKYPKQRMFYVKKP